MSGKTYEEFKQYVKDYFKDCLPEQYRDYELSITQITKCNYTLDGLQCIPVSKDMAVVPCLYVNDMYEHYQAHGDLENTMHLFARQYAELANKSSVLSKKQQEILFDAEKVKTGIIATVVNTASNSELLKNCPHRELKDLSVVYRQVFDPADMDFVSNSQNISSSLITYERMERIGLTEEELYVSAMENMDRIFPTQIQDLGSFLKGMGIPFLSDDTPFIWVITNSKELYGAGLLAFPDKLADLLSQIGEETSFWILPASIHELIAMKKSDVSVEMMEEMSFIVQEVNSSTVDLGDRLSNQVYCFDTVTKQMDCFTNYDQSVFYEEERE